MYDTKMTTANFSVEFKQNQKKNFNCDSMQIYSIFSLSFFLFQSKIYYVNYLYTEIPFETFYLEIF